jgi:hypothetical protein
VGDTGAGGDGEEQRENLAIAQIVLEEAFGEDRDDSGDSGLERESGIAGALGGRPKAS